MKLIFLTLATLLTGLSEGAKFVRLPTTADPFDDGQDHDIGTDPDHYDLEDDDDDLYFAEEHAEADEVEDESANETAEEPLDLAEAENDADEEEEHEETAEDEAEEDDSEASLIQEENDDEEEDMSKVELVEHESVLMDEVVNMVEQDDADSEDEADESEQKSALLREADHDDDTESDEADSAESDNGDDKDASLIQEGEEADHDDDTESDEADSAESDIGDDKDASLIQEGEEADHDDDDESDEADSAESDNGDDNDASLIQEGEEADHDDDAESDEADSAESDNGDDKNASLIQEGEEADSEDVEDAEDEPVDELTAKLNEENTIQDDAGAFLQEGLQNIPPEREYIGSLKNSKAHPYVYKSRKAATNACKSLGYRGLCSKNQVKGWSKCAYGWMVDFKGYWFRKTKRGCGRGKGFRNGKRVKKMGAYCCNMASNSHYIGSLTKPNAHPYVYRTREKAHRACVKAGFRGLCYKSQLEGYAVCAAGWLADSKGYWMDRTKRGCGRGRGFRSWGRGKVGAYCCAPTANNIEYIGNLKDTTAHPYVYKTRWAAKKACKAAGYRGLCTKSQGTGFSKCAAGWYSNFKGYWMHRGSRGCGRGRGWRRWGRGKVGAYCCNLASESKWIGSLKSRKRYVYRSKSQAAKACDKAGFNRLCRKFEVKGYAKCAAGWMEDFKGYWYDRTRKGCGKRMGFRGWGKNSKAGAFCCSRKRSVKYIGNLKKKKAHPYVYRTRPRAEKACKKAGYRRLCYRSEIEGVGKCAAGWMKDYKGYWYPRTRRGCGRGRGYRRWGKGKVGAYCCEQKRRFKLGKKKVFLPMCHEDQLASSKGVWRCDDYSGKKGQEKKCLEKYQEIKAGGKTMHFKCVASSAGGGRFNCLAGAKCQTIFPRR